MPDGWAPNHIVRRDGAVAGGWSGDVMVSNNEVRLEDNGDDEVGDAPTVATPAGVAVGPVATRPFAIAYNDIDVIRRFLREVGGVTESIMDGGSWAGLIRYVQGRFASVHVVSFLFVVTPVPCRVKLVNSLVLR